MNVFRMLLILCAIALTILCIVSLSVEEREPLTVAIAIVGIITSVLAIIATVMWWITDEANSYHCDQLRYFRMSSH